MILLESDLWNRRVKKINVLISSHVKKKTPTQCRSNHQKIIKRHKTVTGIIKFIEGLEGDHSQFEIKLKFKR
jgi:hypothetical protein